MGNTKKHSINVFSYIAFTSLIIYVIFSIFIFSNGFGIKSLEKFRAYLLSAHIDTTLIVFACSTVLVFIPCIILIAYSCKSNLDMLSEQESRLEQCNNNQDSILTELDNYKKKLENIDTSFQNEVDKFQTIITRCNSIQQYSAKVTSRSNKICKKLNKIAKGSSDFNCSSELKKLISDFSNEYSELYK